MRSAAVFSSNLRCSGTRPCGRAGKLRRTEVESLRRIGNKRVVARRKVEARVDGSHRRAMPRVRPIRKIAVLGFACAVLH
jgi:hypothetical protein